jgi:glycosyltransferase involved in cell wall biosynthesis
MPKILGLTTSAFDPASRLRFIQFIPHLKQLGWDVVHRPNVPDRQWVSHCRGRVPRAIHQRGARLLMKYNRFKDVQQARAVDIVFVNRDLAGSGLFFEKHLVRKNPKVIFDFDDAIFIGRNEQAVQWMCRNAAWVTPGNSYLAAYARRHSERVSIIPTVTDTDRFLVRNFGDTIDPVSRVGWSGSDQSIRHTLFPFLPMLGEIQKCVPFELVVISNTPPDLSRYNVRWSFVPWSETEETYMASRMDIGIMPLADDEFQRGKCGLKLLQYMAAGLPTLASPVGVNSELTEHGITGFLADTQREWFEALRILITSPDLRTRMGAAGRNRCVRDYSVRAWLPKLDELFRMVCASASYQ